MKLFVPAIILAMLAAPHCAQAKTRLGTPTAGYVYFHKTGADSTSHNAALETCVDLGRRTMVPYIAGASMGLMGALIWGPSQVEAGHVTLVANIENCMVASGWDVMRLDEVEGKRVAAMDTAGQAQTLAGWVGAENPPGTAARRYETLDGMAFEVAGPFDKARDSLSVTSHGEKLAAIMADPYPGRDNKKWGEDRLTQILETAPGKIPPGSTVIVMRGTANSAPNTWMDMIRLGDAGQAPDGPVTYIRLITPTYPFWVSGLQEETHAFVVPPGRWAMADGSTAGLCLGAPFFQVGEGDAIFAGSFRSENVFQPDLDMAPAQKQLGDNDVARRLKPAAYRNGQTFPCEKFPVTLMYVSEVPGAPFMEDYARGSKAH